MSNWIGPTVKQLWNYAMHVLHNTAAFCLGRSSLHILFHVYYFNLQKLDDIFGVSDEDLSFGDVEIDSPQFLGIDDTVALERLRNEEERMTFLEGKMLMINRARL